jgi:hypothetical protein
VWKQSYAANSLLARSEDPWLTGVVEPDGKVHVVDLRARKEVMTGQMEKENVPEHLRNVQSVHLLTDREQFYFALQSPMEVNNNVRMGGGGVQSNLMPQLGMRAVPINGTLYAFPRDGNGDAEWYAAVKNQFLVLDQFQDLPLVLLTSREQVFQNKPGQPWAFHVSVTCIEKRGGRVVYDTPTKLMGVGNFFGVHMDARARTVELLSYDTRIAILPNPANGGEQAREARPAGDVPALEEPRRGARVNPPAVDRVRIREVANPLPR